MKRNAVGKFFRSRGLSLIEILFVLVVVAQIIVIVATLYQNQLKTRYLEATSKQMQGWLALGLNYYETWQQWPTSIAVLVDGSNYTTSNLCSPWPGNGMYQVYNNNKAESVQNIQCPNKANFSIAYPTPSLATSANYMGVSISMPSSELANRLAAMTPAANATGKVVTAYVFGLAFVQKPPSRSWLVAGGIVSGWGRYNKIPLPSEEQCPKEEGFEAHLIVSPQFYVTDYAKTTTLDGMPDLCDCGDGSVDMTDCMTSWFGYIKWLCGAAINFFGSTTDTQFWFNTLLGNKSGVTGNSQSGYAVTTEQDFVKVKSDDALSPTTKETFFSTYLTFCLPKNSWDVISTKDAKLYSHAYQRQCSSEWTGSSGYNWNPTTGSSNTLACGDYVIDEQPDRLDLTTGD